MNNTLDVCEIFQSIQGESTYAGLPCTFVRLSGCNLRCTYCDTAYALNPGKILSSASIVRQVSAFKCGLVEITGGEPLMQKNTTLLCHQLLKKKYTVLIETNGSLPIDLVPDGCIRIMDVKCPSSGMSVSFHLPNLKQLNQRDECKFVISDRRDFIWAVAFIKKYRIDTRCTVLFSPNMDTLKPVRLAEWILKEKLSVRLGLQIHKIIWDKCRRGV